MDTLEKLSDEQLFMLAEDIKLQLERGAGTRPVIYLLAMQRQRAVLAMSGIINADPEDAKTIRGFQQEIQLYHDLIEHCREMLNRGKEADARIAEMERESLNASLDDMSEEERRALNIEPRGDD